MASPSGQYRLCQFPRCPRSSSRPQCISINHNFFSSTTLPHIYRALDEAQKRVEDSIADVKDMIVSRLGTDSPANANVKDWEREWVGEVQGLLERDAGWGWRGFWETVRRNIVNPPAGPHLSPPPESLANSVMVVLQKYKERREWAVLDDVRTWAEDVIHLVAIP